MKSLFLFVLSASLAGVAVPACADSDVKAGELVFKRCAFCHQVGPQAANVFGPHLNGLFGRRAGSLPDYKYSPAMKKSGIVWSEKSLASFLRSPGEVVPGNKMRFWGMGDDKQIAHLLAYLKTFSHSPDAK